VGGLDAGAALLLWLMGHWTGEFWEGGGGEGCWMGHWAGLVSSEFEGTGEGIDVVELPLLPTVQQLSTD